MSDFKPGLEGVVAFETEIAEPDKDGGSLRYRGVDIEELVGHVSYGHVWGLLVDNAFGQSLASPEAVELPVRTGDARIDAQSGVAALAARWGLRPLYDITPEQAREDVGRASAQLLSFIAQSARGTDLPPVPQRLVDEATSPRRGISHPLARRAGSAARQGARRVLGERGRARHERLHVHRPGNRVHRRDVAAALSGAVGALSGPLHGSTPARVLHMVEEVERTGDAEGYVKGVLDRHDRLMGFGHRVYRAEDPRARVLRRTAKELGAPRFEVALALENAALAELRARRPDRVLETNVEFWAAIVLDFAEVPADVTPVMFTCARTAGWSAHIMEQKLTGRLVRPSARYIGPSLRPVREVPGAAEVLF